MKTSKYSNYQWLLDAGHCGWENEKRQRMNSQSCVTLLAAMLKKAGIDFSLVSHGNRETPFNKRISKVKDLCARKKRCIYLSLQINNMKETEPEVGVETVILGRDHASVFRVRALLDQIYGSSLPDKPGFDWQAVEPGIVENLRGLLKAKCSKALVTYYEPGGARYAIRKMLRRRIAQTLLRFIRAMEKQKPV